MKHYFSIPHSAFNILLLAYLAQNKDQSQVQYLPPTFFIIGERKCATSSLYRYLIDHPQILPCRIKEPQFFSKPFWYRLLFASRYRALFPRTDAVSMKMQWLDLDEEARIVSEELVIHRDPHDRVITGEASANAFAQVPPRRLKRAYPEAKLILCLRHPVDRAFSHYRMLQRFTAEGRRIPFQMTDFKTDFIADLHRGKKEGKGYFAGVSMYAGRLRTWIEVFGKEKIYILRMEDLREQETAQRILSDLCHFLSLRDHDFSGVLQLKVNRSDNAGLDPMLRKELSMYFERDIQTLEELTGRKFDWVP
jgi:hypothetical protein